MNNSTFWKVRLIFDIAAGSTFGFSLGNYIFAYIGRYLHWKYIFHLTSLCGIVWTVAWYSFIIEYPNQHPTISIKEKTKILKHRKQTIDEEKVNIILFNWNVLWKFYFVVHVRFTIQIPIPWKDILTSIPVAVCTLVNAVTLCYFLLLRTFIPIYLQNTYNLDSNEVSGICSY